MRSEQINELAAALAKAQGQMRAANKDAKNPRLGNSYATFDSVVEAIRKPAADNGLAYSQILQSGADNVYVLETWLMHESGQFLQSELEVTPLRIVSNQGKQVINDMQALGSGLTYAKRYALAAMLGVSVDEDDDGNGSAPAQTGKMPHQKPKPQPKNGNGTGDIPNSPQKMLDYINPKVQVTYDGLEHLFNAAAQESTLEKFSWPSDKDIAGWRRIKDDLIKHAEAKTKAVESAEGE
jgi:hypothetical protein